MCIMNGILIVDKEVGYTSRDVVNIISKELGTKKVGHTGTLDPMASGVLVVCVGKALKVSELITSYDKEYIARVRLGYETDTLDNEGIIVKSSEFREIIRDEILDTLNKFVGNIKQEVPKYSAIKVNGKKLYEYARNGIDVELPVKDVSIYSLELVSDIEYVNGYYEFDIRCLVSKGTYIRSLVRDIGVNLGTYATMIGLRRIKQGKFDINESYTLDDVRNGKYKMLNISEVLDIGKVVVDEDMAFRVKNGQVLDKFFDDDMVMVLNNNQDLLAIYEQANDGKVKPWKVF